MDEVFQFEGFRLHRPGGDLYRRDERGAFVPITIGSRALDVLGVLVGRPGDLVSRREIIAAVWPSTVVEDSNLNMQIAALRRVLDEARAEGSCIQTISGRGYRFVVPVTRVAAQARSNVAAPTQSGVLAPPRLSIVVLPFTNLSDDREQQYFADGITDDLTTDLSRLENMFVISRNTAFTYRTKAVDSREIGRELGVRYVLEGSIRRSGAQVRLNAQLIDTATGAHLWAERFDGEISDLFTLQNDITGQIAAALTLELVGAEASRPPEDADALDNILRGRAALSNPRSRRTYAEAMILFERALALDPRSVGAQCWLAVTLASRVINQMTDTTAADIARAEGLVAKALAASPRRTIVHFARGEVVRAQRRYDQAIPIYETVLASDRNSVWALFALGACKLMTGSVEEVIPLMERAIRLSPRDPQIAVMCYRIGEVHLLQSRIDKAIAWLERARSANLELPYVHAFLASAFALKGETERAVAELDQARRLSDGYSSIAQLTAGFFWVPRTRPLFEATYLAGLRKAGMPEE